MSHELLGRSLAFEVHSGRTRRLTKAALSCVRSGAMGKRAAKSGQGQDGRQPKQLKGEMKPNLPDYVGKEVVNWILRPHLLSRNK